MSNSNDYNSYINEHLNQVRALLEECENLQFKKLPSNFKEKCKNLLEFYKNEEEEEWESDESVVDEDYEPKTGYEVITDGPSDIIEFNLKEGDERAETLTAQTDVHGWLKKIRTFRYSLKFYALIYKGTLYLYKEQSDEKPCEKLKLEGGELTERGTNCFDIKVWNDKNKQVTHNFKVHNHYQKWKTAITNELQPPHVPPHEALSKHISISSYSSRNSGINCLHSFFSAAKA